jgi:hypothetical protein
MRNEITGLWGTLACVGLLAYFCSPLDAIVGINVLIASYQISRVLAKKNRGGGAPGLQTTEFLLNVFALSLNIVAMLDVVALGAVMLVAQQALYNLCRGLTKGISGSGQSILL